MNFPKKNSGIVDEQPKKNRRNHKNELQTSTSSTETEKTFNLFEEPRIIGTTKDDDSDCDFEDSSSLLSEQDCDYDSNCDDEDSSSLLSEYECDDRSDCDGEDFDSDCDIAGVIWPPPSSNETSMGRVDCPDENLDRQMGSAPTSTEDLGSLTKNPLRLISGPPSSERRDSDTAAAPVWNPRTEPGFSPLVPLKDSIDHSHVCSPLTTPPEPSAPVWTLRPTAPMFSPLVPLKTHTFLPSEMSTGPTSTTKNPTKLKPPPREYDPDEIFGGDSDEELYDYSDDDEDYSDDEDDHYDSCFGHDRSVPCAPRPLSQSQPTEEGLRAWQEERGLCLGQVNHYLTTKAQITLMSDIDFDITPSYPYFTPFKLVTLDLAPSGAPPPTPLEYIGSTSTSS